MSDFLRELERCTLCEWRCGVNRRAGERGVCGIGIPEVAAAMLHPVPLAKPLMPPGPLKTYREHREGGRMSLASGVQCCPPHDAGPWRA